MFVPDRPKALINWHWLEDLLVRAGELEIRAFGERHSEERFFAFCLEFDGIDGSTRLSYGTRDAVEQVERGLRSGGENTTYRAVELAPEHWKHRALPFQDPEGYYATAQSIIEQYAELMREDREPDEAEFYWLRFEYLTECVVRRLIERDAFRHLWREEEFVAFSHCEAERLEELEDRLEKLYPAYRRATMEWMIQPKPGESFAVDCEGRECPGAPPGATLARCTCCQQWFCDECRSAHAHPELAGRQPFFF